MKLTKEAIKFSQTARTGWVLKMNIEEIILKAPARGPQQLSFDFTETNRPITSRHLGSIERFLTDTPDWAMPPIILAADQGTVTEKTKNISFETDDLRILDGQHRIQAFSKVVYEMTLTAGREREDDAKERLDAINKQEVPAVIIEVPDKKDQRQLFAWFARSRPIEPAVREYFDESDPFGKAAKAAMETSVVLQDNVTYKVRSVPPRDRDLMSLSNLKDIVTTIQLGIARTPKAEDRTACWGPEVQEVLQQKLLEFFDEFLPECKPNYEILSKPGQIRNEILRGRSISYALQPPVIRLMANCWARWTHDRGKDPEDLTRHIGQMKMKRADPLNELEHELGVIIGERKKFQGIRDKSWESATTAIIKAAQERQ